MTKVFAGIRWLSRFLHGIGGVCLVSLMLVTCADVALRFFRKPIPGTYELVGFAAALAIGLAMPYTLWMRGHVYMDSLTHRLPPAAHTVLHVVTRLMAAALFVLLGWNLVSFGLDLRSNGEVSPTLELRFYPVAFGLAVACFLQVIIVACDLVKPLRGDHE